MPNSIFRKEIIQFSFTNRKIQLTNTQLFFIENFLRKKQRSSIIHHRTQLVDGQLLITITRGESNIKIDKVLSKVLNYLIAFQSKELLEIEVNEIVSVKTLTYQVDPIEITHQFA